MKDITNQTYTETKKEAPFNWNVFLQQAIKTRGKSVDAKTQKKVNALSESWVTCACGTQCSILDREFDGEPCDETLYEEGMEFMNNIQDCEWGKAKRTLARIEKRSAKLIDEKLQEHIKVLKDFGYTVTAPKK